MNEFLQIANRWIQPLKYEYREVNDQNGVDEINMFTIKVLIVLYLMRNEIQEKFC